LKNVPKFVDSALQEGQVRRKMTQPVNISEKYIWDSFQNSFRDRFTMASRTGIAASSIIFSILTIMPVEIADRGRSTRPEVESVDI